MESFKRLMAFAKPFSRFWPGYLILSIFSVIFGVLNYALIGPLINVLFDPENIKQQQVMPEFSLTPEYFQELFRYGLTSVMQDFGVLKALMFVCGVFIFA